MYFSFLVVIESFKKGLIMAGERISFVYAKLAGKMRLGPDVHYPSQLLITCKR